MTLKNTLFVLTSMLTIHFGCNTQQLHASKKTEVPAHSKHKTCFEYGAIGDQDYEALEYPEFFDNPLPQGTVRSAWLQIINDINASNLAFTIHDGDIGAPYDGLQQDGYIGAVCDINGGTTLEDKIALLDTFSKPLIYTPGDNEWSDCFSNFIYSPFALNPSNNLDKIRQLSQSDPTKSLGVKKMKIMRQPNYPENVMFSYGKILFVTINIPSGDNCPQLNVVDETVVLGDCSEADARQQANIQWLTLAFQEANAKDMKGVSITVHADLKISSDGTYAELPTCTPGSSFELTTDTGLGPFQAALATFSPIPTTDIVADGGLGGAAEPYQACSALPANSLDGVIAVVRRGSCTYSSKVQNTTNAGAIATVIVNTSDTPTTPGGSSVVGAGPTLMISKTDGDLLINHLVSNPSVEITLTLIPDGPDGALPRYTTIIETINELCGQYPKLKNLLTYGDSHQLRFSKRLAAPNIRTFNTYGPEGTSEGSNALIDPNITTRWASVVVDEKSTELYKFNGYDSNPAAIKTPVLNYRFGTSGKECIRLASTQSGSYRAHPVQLVKPETQMLLVSENIEGLSDPYDISVQQAAVDAGYNKAVQIQVLPGTAQLAIAVDGFNSKNDIDIFLFRDDQLVMSSFTNQLEEFISVEYPEPGVYTLFIDGYCVMGNGVDHVRARIWNVLAQDDGSLTISHAPSKVECGQTNTLKYHWKDLCENELYYGAVEHIIDNVVVATTFIRINTGETSSTLMTARNTPTDCEKKSKRLFRFAKPRKKQFSPLF